MGNLLDSRKFYIWGTGFRSKQLNQFYEEQLERIELLGYLDNDASKWGKQFYGHDIYSPEILKEDRERYLVITSKFYDEILQQIKEDYPWYQNRIVDGLFFERLQLISRYETSEEPEIRDILTYLEDHPLQVFNDPFVEKYQKEDSVVSYDKEKQLYYTMFDHKKMYFSRTFQTEERVKEYYQSICLEQDSHSPHRYLTETFDVPDQAVVIDAGVAEGNFALGIIDRVKKIYLFEPDQDWAEALSYTFEPYQDKVVIINKCLSNYVGGNTTTIDETVKGETVDFIKMDIEGEEYYALQGAEKTIAETGHIRCVVCTYHQEFAYAAIRGLLETLRFETETSKGYMWYPDSYCTMRAPILRRGVIRAEKRGHNEE